MEKMWEGLPIIIFGIGGCAKEIKLLIEEINQHNKTKVFNFLGYVSNNTEDIGKKVDGYEVVASNYNFIEFSKQYPLLGVCIGLGDPSAKYKIYTSFLQNINNIVFPNLIHPNSYVPTHVNNNFGYGNVICSGVSITTNITLGNFVLLNRNCAVGHDSFIGDYCTINPLAVVSGNVKVDSLSLIGAGSSIKENLQIGEGSIVGLGAIIVKNVEENQIYMCKAAEARRVNNEQS
ncbi:hypothetical protein [Paenibacillus sp. 1P03SA]|uniref:hypothetical protein n=1 Tax=Paenibacillus sp. 1P03SA TaxID=3132294 RepID=UPI0039A29D12